MADLFRLVLQPVKTVIDMASWVFALFNHSFPPKSKWNPDDIPDLSDKVYLITGANTGIGKEVARDLLEHNGKVYIAARSPEKTAEAIEDLKRTTGKGDDRVHYLKLDLVDLQSVKAAVDEFLSKESRLDVLINNAGVFQLFGAKPEDKITSAGLNVEFAVNVLGHFYLTQLLLPTLLSTAKSSSDGKVRVLNVSSITHMFSKTGKNGPVDYRTLEGPRPLSWRSYAQSKSGNILFSNELARRYGNQGIVSISIHPGAIDSSLYRNSPGYFYELMRTVFLFPVSYGKISISYAATAPEAAELNGKYLVPWARVASLRKDHMDPKKEEKLWEWLEEKVKALA